MAFHLLFYFYNLLCIYGGIFIELKINDLYFFYKRSGFVFLKLSIIIYLTLFNSAFNLTQ
jgi:hypothetical protein